MSATLAKDLMEEFAVATGITGDQAARRYLWTDAFAVCNYLGIYQQSGNDRYLDLARKLVDQVHHTLGRHRDDDERTGWISGLPETEGEQHPTAGGLRIGKKFNERAANQAMDSQLEWDRDGQYFHYLTKWMHALYRMGQVTQEDCFHRWAIELSIAAFPRFIRAHGHSQKKRIAWKISIDLSRPLINSTGQHDALDGLISVLTLQTTSIRDAGVQSAFLAVIDDLEQMCRQRQWMTEDALGIGGLLVNGCHLSQLVFDHELPYQELLLDVIVAALASLRYLRATVIVAQPVNRRLAFRELGLCLGLQGVNRMRHLCSGHPALRKLCDELYTYQFLSQQIHDTWTTEANRKCSTWRDHEDINNVMLATSLMPDSFLQA